jgi:hypothetical protein
MARLLTTDRYTGAIKEIDLAEYLQRHTSLDVSVIRGTYGSRLSIKLLLEKEDRYSEYIEICEGSVDIKDIMEK